MERPSYLCDGGTDGRENLHDCTSPEKGATVLHIVLTAPPPYIGFVSCFCYMLCKSAINKQIIIKQELNEPRVMMSDIAGVIWNV